MYTLQLKQKLFPDQFQNIFIFKIMMPTFKTMKVQILFKGKYIIIFSCRVHIFYPPKELGCFHIIFAQILTAHNFCLTHITASILIYANALGYFLSIKIEFVMRNLISIFFMLLYMERGV